MTEGESVVIRVLIISPVDIGNARVYLEVATHGVPAAASKFT